MTTTEKNLSILKDSRGNDVALEGVKVRARLCGLMSEVEVEQCYTNPQNINIEVIYTFPLPLGATLLGLEVEIAGKKLIGTVVEKKQAESQYEDAITDGDSAIMLEQVGPGLYNVNVGNLLASESAIIRYRYVLLLTWQDDRLRFLLPTTIAPRYGDPLAAGLLPHQVPGFSLHADYPLDLAVVVEGELAHAVISSPSHAITIEQSGHGVEIRLNRKSYLDRDFILSIQSEAAQSSCILTPDSESFVALASLRIPQLQDENNRPLALKVAIDCSGSMAGSSIVQARKAALEILNLLQPQDRFNVTLFGDKHSHIFPALVSATSRNITTAASRLASLDADMGGTEMYSALEAIFSMGGIAESATLLLVTDGEIYEHEKLVAHAKSSGHCVFTVGVGTAVNEPFLKSLSASTGGACELVSPQEGMAERVVMQFHRMRQPKLRELCLKWPVMPDWQTPLPDAAFAGDTVHVFAGFQHAFEGDITLEAQDTTPVIVTIKTVNDAEIPRLAAAQRMEASNEQDGLQLALDYQLLSRWTNFLVIAERADKANDLPVLHHVPQMLAAGWGGIGSIVHCCQPDTHTIMRAGRRAAIGTGELSGIDIYDIPSFLRKQVSESIDETPIPAISTPARFVENFAKKYSPSLWRPKLPKSIAQLVAIAIDEDVACGLMEIVDTGLDEAEVVAAFIYALSESVIGDGLGSSLKRVIFKNWKQVVTNHEIDVEIQKRLSLLTAESWNWLVTLQAVEV